MWWTNPTEDHRGNSLATTSMLKKAADTTNTSSLASSGSQHEWTPEITPVSSCSSTATPNITNKVADPADGELPHSFPIHIPTLTLRLGVLLKDRMHPYLVAYSRDPPLLCTGSGPPSSSQESWQEIGSTNVKRDTLWADFEEQIKVPWRFAQGTEVKFELRSESQDGKDDAVLGSALLAIDVLVTRGAQSTDVDLLSENGTILGSLTVSALPSTMERDEATLLNSNWLTDEEAEARGVAPYVPEWYVSSALTLQAWIAKQTKNATLLNISAKADLSKNFAILSKKKKKVLLSGAGLSLHISLWDSAHSCVASQHHLPVLCTVESKPHAKTGIIRWPDILVARNAIIGSTLLLSIWADTEAIGACTISANDFVGASADTPISLYGCSSVDEILEHAEPLVFLRLEFSKARGSSSSLAPEFSEQKNSEFDVLPGVQLEYNRYLRSVLQSEKKKVSKLLKRELRRRNRDKQILSMLFGKVRVSTRFYLDYSWGNGNFSPSSDDPNSFLHYGGADSLANPYANLMQALSTSFMHLNAGNGIEALAYGCTLTMAEGGRESSRWAMGNGNLSEVSSYLKLPRLTVVDGERPLSPLSARHPLGEVWGAEEDHSPKRTTGVSIGSISDFSLPSSPRVIPYCLPFDAHLMQRRKKAPGGVLSSFLYGKPRESGEVLWEAEDVDNLPVYDDVASLLQAYNRSWANLDPLDSTACISRAMRHAIETCDPARYTQVFILASSDISHSHSLDKELMQAASLPLSFVVFGLSSILRQGFPNIAALKKRLLNRYQDSCEDDGDSRLTLSFIEYHTWAEMLATASEIAPKHQREGVDLAPLSRAAASKILSSWGMEKQTRQQLLGKVKGSSSTREATMTKDEMELTFANINDMSQKNALHECRSACQRQVLSFLKDANSLSALMSHASNNTDASCKEHEEEGADEDAGTTCSKSRLFCADEVESGPWNRLFCACFMT